MKRQIPIALAVFLVLLRLAIGWHFFIEGSKKVQSFQYDEKSVAGKPFSSAAYLRGSSGPLADFYRQQGGDLDREALARLDVRQPGPEHADGRKGSYRDLLSDALSKHYDDYFERFVAHLQLSDQPVEVSHKVAVPFVGEVWVKDRESSGRPQLELARARLDLAKEKAARWLLGKDAREHTVEVDASDLFKTGPVKVKKTFPERVQAYRHKLEEIRSIEREQLPAFEKPVRKDLQALKAEAAQMRAGLMRELDKVLTDRLEGILTAKQKQKLKDDPLPPAPPSKWEAFRDRAVAWGLLAVGACLLVGLLTRTACVLGALFLLSVYLAYPPFLGVPEAARAEGFYYLVNKNLIEMLALLALAVTPSGRWLGLDSLVHYFNPFRRRQRPEKPAPADGKRKEPGPVADARRAPSAPPEKMVTE